MRTDCSIDARQVICPKATTLGFATIKCRVGSYFVYAESRDEDGFVTSSRMARMLGRISFAPALPESDGRYAPGAKHVRNHILAMVWIEMGHCAERWIDPTDVLECYAEPPADIAAFFFAPKLPYGAQTIRRLMEYGTCSAGRAGNIPECVAEFTARDAAVSLSREVQSC